MDHLIVHRYMFEYVVPYNPAPIHTIIRKQTPREYRHQLIVLIRQAPKNGRINKFLELVRVRKPKLIKAYHMIHRTITVCLFTVV